MRFQGPRLTALLFLLCVGTAALLGCARATPEGSQGDGEAVRVTLGQEFELRVGQRAAVEGEGFTVRFDSVANDSRCPTDVDCVWAGNAEVMIEVAGDGDPARLMLNTHGGEQYPTEARHGPYTVALVALSPLPSGDSPVAAEEYMATLVVSEE